jgi:hypothetical protein
MVSRVCPKNRSYSAQRVFAQANCTFCEAKNVFDNDFAAAKKKMAKNFKLKLSIWSTIDK